MEYTINGIQQIGIGVRDAKDHFNWYRRHMGFDILVFEDSSVASLMTRYTDDRAMERYALLAMNMQGGGGLELWQFANREPQSAVAPFQLGDLGINMMKIRTKTATKANQFIQDPSQNWIQFVADDYRFAKTKASSGGVKGAIIGVSDIDNSVPFYQQLFGFDLKVYDECGYFSEFKSINGGNSKFRRVLLKHKKRATGGFGRLLGPCEIELIQVLDRTPNTIYQDRLWGDLGFIHLCFDVAGISALKKRAKALGHAFTVDSAESFDMGEAAGRFAYIEDPDGTLIELVETHKVPILKKLGIYINLERRDRTKPLPNWMVKAMKIHRRNKDL
ncbi:MAG: VOC family protein [Croceitalea sp.]|nr:VOC family protein [Croceitalea sp.]